MIKIKDKIQEWDLKTCQIPVRLQDFVQGAIALIFLLKLLHIFFIPEERMVFILGTDNKSRGFKQYAQLKIK